MFRCWGRVYRGRRRHITYIINAVLGQGVGAGCWGRGQRDSTSTIWVLLCGFAVRSVHHPHFTHICLNHLKPFSCHHDNRTVDFEDPELDVAAQAKQGNLGPHEIRRIAQVRIIFNNSHSNNLFIQLSENGLFTHEHGVNRGENREYD